MQKRFYTKTPLHTQTSLHRSFSHTHFYTQTTFLHYEYMFAQTRLKTDTETLLHTAAFTHTDELTQESLYKQIAFTHRRFYTQTPLRIDIKKS